MPDWAKIVAFIVAGVLAWVFAWPAIEGYHIGYNSATDTACFTRLVQWCK